MGCPSSRMRWQISQISPPGPTSPNPSLPLSRPTTITTLDAPSAPPTTTTTPNEAETPSPCEIKNTQKQNAKQLTMFTRSIPKRREGTSVAPSLPHAPNRST
ncbi:hypothetical protein V8G54_018409 [Vigna mungo]|uniref:Uncharacterized protein n=1 Tax=Vigna mungo TaxID=3915 RepID=A0AAQ3N9C4_VIGMU